MKISLPRLLITITAALSFLAFAMIISLESHGARNAQAAYTAGLSDSIVIHKHVTSRLHKVGLYPDASQKVLFFTVRGEHGKVYQLYVFNMEGTLVKQSEIRNKQTTYISNMEKGVYLFDVFCDDDKIGDGQIAIR